MSRFVFRSKSMLLVVCSMPLTLGGCDCNGKVPVAQNNTSVSQTPTAEKTQEPLIRKAGIVDWCKEHGVPESICTRCNKDLIEGFKKKGDWCGKHGLPESQCLVCHPDLKAKFEAMRPKQG